MKELAPILIFTYNRPEHARRLLESLSANKLADKSHVIIYSDAPRDEADAPLVAQTRRIIHEAKGFGSVDIIERQSNMGLANSIIDGVSEWVNRCGRVIVLEDDLVVAPHFLRFMNDALTLYADEPRVGHIQACDFTQDSSLPDTFLIKWTGSWGWGTWARAWSLFNPDGTELLRQIEERGLSREFDFGGKYPYTRMLRRQVQGKNNSWAIRWNATLFLADILSLNVGRSLVVNHGFDGTGTNCGGGDLYQSVLYDEVLPVKKIEPIIENKAARKVLASYYARTNSFLAKAIRRIRRILHGDFGA